MALKLSRPRRAKPAENTIALINIVFLMLIFFLVAGSLTPPLDSTIAMIETEDAGEAQPPDALAVSADGTFRYRGSETTLAAYLAAHAPQSATGPASLPFKLVVDRGLPASRLIAITAELRAEGLDTVTVVTERRRR